MPQAVFDYHYGLEAEQYAFFRIPKILMTEQHFKDISTDAKLLYGMMIDRMSLSIKNGWMDENERVYIYFTVDEVCEQFCCHTGKAVKMFNELDTENGIGLIQRMKQGQGKPARIYVMRFLGITESSASAKSKSRLAKTESQDLRKSQGNNTDFSKTDLSIYPAQPSPMDVMDGYREQIKTNIEYDYLIRQYPYDDLDEIVDLMLEVLCTQEDFVRIGTKQIYTVLARERFLKLDSSHIEYVLDSMRNTTSDIRNIKAYLLWPL